MARQELVEQKAQELGAGIIYIKSCDCCHYVLACVDAEGSSEGSAPPANCPLRARPLILYVKG